jgi:hypothetical protein
MSMKRLTFIAILATLIALPLLAFQGLDWTKIEGAKIMVPIKVDTAEGQYNDSLYYSAAEWERIDERAIEEAKAVRVKNWVDFVVAAKSAPHVEPTKEELIAQQDETLKRMDALLTQLATAATKADLQEVAVKLKVTSDALAASIAAKK